jgi:predicted phosphodiesterase
MYELSRRAFLQQGTLVMMAAASGRSVREALAIEQTKLRFGLITDIHYADRDPAINRYYRESIAKVREAVAKFRREHAAFLIQVGDLIDEAPTAEGELGHLRTINAELAKFEGDRYHVLGNHDLWTLTKEQFLEGAGMKAGHYSFDKGDFHFVVLDACYRRDGVAYGAKNSKWDDTDVPAAQRGWLADDLKATGKPTVVFIHHRTDIVDPHAITSGAEVRKILEASGKVLTVFSGHQHINAHTEINGIHYVTMMATVDGSGETNNAYALVDILEDHTIVVNGFRRQDKYALTPPSQGVKTSR